MKISDEYPNFYEAMLFFMNSNDFSIPSNDAIKLSFIHPNQSHKSAFDYYELNPTGKGGVFF
mgnify:CR=1 FL=1